MGDSMKESAIGLLERAARGDRKAFTDFYDRYSSLVFAFALRVLKDRSVAEDILQEVFIQVWRQAGNYKEDRGSPEAWLMNLTRSRAIDRLRSIRRTDRSFVSREDSEAGQPQPVGSFAQDVENKITVTGALATLSQDQRIVLEMSYFEDLSQSEIAVRLAEPLGTVKTRMRAGLQKLRELMGK